MKNKLNYIFILALMMGIFTTSCKTPPTNKEKTAQNDESSLKIQSVTWLVERLHPSIWDKTPANNAEMFISFFVSYSGEFDTNLIKSILVESPVDMWSLNTEHLKRIVEIQEEKQLAVVKRLQCGIGLGSIPLGEWNFVLIQNDGSKYEKKLNITGFEKSTQKTSNENNEEPIHSVKNEKDNTTKAIVAKASSKDDVDALLMPVINSVSRDEDSIEIFFTVNDTRVKNGYFWFDVPGEKYYKDSGSMIDGSGMPVNGCRAFTVDGEKSHYILRRDSENGEWFDKITDCFFVASDTNRVSAPWEERIRTVSAKAQVK